MASILPGLRFAAPRISKDVFIYQFCRVPSRPVARLKDQFAAATSRRFKSETATIRRVSGRGRWSAAGPAGRLARSLKKSSVSPASSAESEKAFFPAHTSNTVAYWLLGSAASVFGIVVFGGLTRLTESGLSITEWKPVTGSLPPLSLEDWESEFTKYRASPEFKLLNPHMTLEEFKKIYYMEWGHRLWGRVVGLSFVLPAIYFVARRKVSAGMSLRLLGISSLIGFQGFLGWYMVKSGLKDDLFAPGSHPRVSQYRLAAHLGTAFLCYMAMVWNGLSIIKANKFGRLYLDPTTWNSTFKSFNGLRLQVKFLLPLVFLTAMSGALVAGLDAGMIYNEFPYMGTGLTPPKSELFSTFYCRKDDHSDLIWRNMFENPSLVQLNHRILAVTTFSSVIGMWALKRLRMPYKAPQGGVYKALRGCAQLVTLQATLGISTLIYLVPIPLAAAHQAGALALITGVLVLVSRLWIPKAIRVQLAQAQATALQTSKLRHTNFQAPVSPSTSYGAFAASKTKTYSGTGQRNERVNIPKIHRPYQRPEYVNGR